MQTPSVFDYSDYRSFLKTYADIKRQKSPRWSYGSWARQLDLKGTASLTMIINGQRRPGPKVIDSLVKYFKFNKAEKRFFETLVQLEKSVPGSEHKMELLQSINPFLAKNNLNFIDVHSFSVISDWYHYAIRQMTYLSDFCSDIKWIKQQLRFSVSEAEIKKSIDRLVQLKLLSRDAKGRLKSTSENLEVEFEVASEAVKMYHTNVMNLAKKSLFQDSLENREMSALTLAVDSSQIDEAKKLIFEFKNKMRLLADQSPKNSVYQLNIQFFPLVKEEIPKENQ